jgi:ribosome biogenesis GTPase
VGSVSEATGKGTHTTTTAELMPLPYGGFVVDTPGLKEFGLWRASLEELSDAFPEISAVAGDCRFANCSHSHEPDCAVCDAVENGAIDPHRHTSFSKLLAEIDEPT